MIETVSIDLTYNCNLRCLHCFNSSGEHSKKKQLMSNDEIFNIVKDIVKLNPKNICFCGGETMLRKDILIKCSNFINEASNNKIVVTTVSNGFIINDLLAKELKACGLNSIQISLDGATAKTHDWLRNKEGSFERAINAIKVLKANGFNVAVAFTPNKINIGELDEAFELAKSFGIFAFRVQPIMSLGRAKRNLQDYIPTYEDYMNIRFKLLSKQKDEGNKHIYIEWGDPLMHLISGRNNKDTLGYLTINGYGDLLISPYLPVTLGNVRKNSIFQYIDAGILSIWENLFIQKLTLKMDTWENMDLSRIGFPEIFIEDNIDMDLLKNKSELNVDKYMQLL